MNHRGRSLVVWGTALVAGLTGGCTRVDSGPAALPRRALPPPSAIDAGVTDAWRLPPSAPVHPNVERVVLGHSVRGTPLVMEILGNGRETVLIHGGIHGNEASSAGVAQSLARYLRARPALWHGRRIAILAEVNPDGLAAGTRVNARGVDLNRNFPARNWRSGKQHGSGPAPGSEPETQALMAAVRELQPARIVALHSIARGRHCNNFDGPATDLARQMSALNGYRVTPAMGYETPGSFGSWAGVDLQIPTITLELPRDLPTVPAWAENVDALLAFIDGVVAK